MITVKNKLYQNVPLEINGQTEILAPKASKTFDLPKATGQMISLQKAGFISVK